MAEEIREGGYYSSPSGAFTVKVNAVKHGRVYFKRVDGINKLGDQQALTIEEFNTRYPTFVGTKG